MKACPRCYAQISSAGPCPKCGFFVPPQWLEQVQLAIAITGARTVGKSVLIGVMMDQFRYFLQERHESFLIELGTTAERFQAKYRNPLFVERSLLQPTPRAEREPIEPMMWSFSYAGQQVCLSIIDAAGEDFQLVSPGDPIFRYLGYSDVIMSLIDPLKVPGVSAVLEDVVSVPASSGDDLNVLRLVLAARQFHRGSDSPDQVLAIALSKFDVLQRLREVSAAPWQSIMNRPGSTLQRDPSMTSQYENRRDADLLHAELESLLPQLGAQLVLSAAKNSGLPYRLFATSALGSEPNASTVGRGGIIPFRVLDVLQAALAKKLGIR